MLDPLLKFLVLFSFSGLVLANSIVNGTATVEKEKGGDLKCDHIGTVDLPVETESDVNVLKEDIECKDRASLNGPTQSAEFLKIEHKQTATPFNPQTKDTPKVQCTKCDLEVVPDGSAVIVSCFGCSDVASRAGETKVGADFHYLAHFAEII